MTNKITDTMKRLAGRTRDLTGESAEPNTGPSSRRGRVPPPVGEGMTGALRTSPRARSPEAESSRRPFMPAPDQSAPPTTAQVRAMEEGVDPSTVEQNTFLDSLLALPGSYPLTTVVNIAGLTTMNKTKEGPPEPATQRPVTLNYNEPVPEISGDFNTDLATVKQLINRATTTSRFSLDAKNAFSTDPDPTPSLLNALPASVLSAINGVASVGRSVSSYMYATLPEPVREVSANLAASSANKGKAVMASVGVGLPGKVSLAAVVSAMHANPTMPSHTAAHDALITRQRALRDQQIIAYQARLAAAALDLAFRQLFKLVPSNMQVRLNRHLLRVADLEQTIENATIDLDEMPAELHDELPGLITSSRSSTSRALGQLSGGTGIPSQSAQRSGSAARPPRSQSPESVGSSQSRVSIQSIIDARTRHEDRLGAREELRNLEQRLNTLVTSLPDNLRSAVDDIFQSLGQIKDQFNSKWSTCRRQIDQANTRIARAIRAECARLADEIPGFEAVAGPDGDREKQGFTAFLRDMGIQLLQRLNNDQDLPADSALRYVIDAASLSCGRDPGAAHQELMGLRELTLSDLRASMQNEQRFAIAARLVELPLGFKVLQAILAQAESPMPNDEKRDNALVVALQSSAAAKALQLENRLTQGGAPATIEMAEMGLASVHSENPTLAFLASARDAAFSILENKDIKSLPSELRIAYGAAKYGLWSKAAGSPFDMIDKAMRSLTSEMLDSATLKTGGTSAKSRALGAAFAALPIASATPFNPEVLKATVKVAKSIGLAVAPTVAAANLRNAAAAWVESIAGTEGNFDQKMARIQNVNQRCLAELYRYFIQSVNLNDSSQALSDSFSRDNENSFGLALLVSRMSSQSNTQLESLGYTIANAPITHYPIMEALSSLVNFALEADAKPSKELAAFAKTYRHLKAALYFDSGPEIVTQAQLDMYIEILASNVQLRDRLKIASGKTFGGSPSALSGFAITGPLTVSGQADLRYTHQIDKVLEIGMGTQAFYLAITAQSTNAFTYLGLSAGLAGNIDSPSAGYRPRATGKIKQSLDKQVQTGVMLRVPRFKATEEDDRLKFMRMVPDLVNWRIVTFADGKQAQCPLDVILHEHSDTSVNLLGEYDRTQVKKELGVGVFPLSFGGPVVTRLGVDFTSANVSSTTRAKEVSGSLRYQDTRVGEQAVGKASAAFTAAFPAKSFKNMAGKVKGGLRVAGGNLAASADVSTKGIDVMARLTTVNDVTKPLQSRYIVETLNFEEFEHRVMEEWALWVNHGINYTTADATKIQPLRDANCSDADILRIRQATHENELKGFLRACKENLTEFSLFAIVKALTEVVALQEIRFRGEMMIARQGGQPEQAAQLQFQLDDLLKEPASWQERRLVRNLRANEKSQVGIDFGGVANVSYVVEGFHNELCYPKG